MSIENQEFLSLHCHCSQRLVQRPLQMNYRYHFEFYFSLSLKAIQIMCMWTCTQQGYCYICLLLLNFHVAFDSFDHQL